MKNLKLILLLQAFVFGVLTVNADDDCCPDGSDPSYECVDGTMVCDASECPPCTTDNPNPSTDMECCGGVEIDPADFCCDANDQTPIDKNNPEPAPTITGPSGGTNMVNKSITVPAPQFNVAFVGTTPLTVDPNCDEETYIYEKTIYTPTDAVINNISKENRWTSSGVTGDAGSCGIELNMTVPTGAAVTVTVGGGFSIPPFSFSVSTPIQIQPATSVNCDVDSQSNRWIYYEIFEHSAKLSGGTTVLTYDISYERQYRYCNQETDWANHGQGTSGHTASQATNISGDWEDTNAEYCSSATNRCCPGS